MQHALLHRSIYLRRANLASRLVGKKRWKYRFNYFSGKGDGKHRSSGRKLAEFIARGKQNRSKLL